MNDLKYIKKHYGENFAHLCRSLFPTILQTEGLLTKIISESFAPSRDLYYAVLDCLPQFQEYIYSFIEVKDKKEVDKESVKTPEQLLDEAGYILYPECQNENEVRYFMKYYTKYERLCTFNRERLQTCRVWFAVKKNVDQIKREDFTDPQRQDEYGTSVISIQCTRSNLSTLSIKNRYNHQVDNPDATFDNNLDNIIEGLTDSFMAHFGLSLIDSKMASFELKGFARANNGRFYKRNLFVNNVDYCENNVILNHRKLMTLDPSRYLLIDNYIVDFVNKTIAQYPARKLDSFAHSIGKIKNIKIRKDDQENKIIEVEPVNGKLITITANKRNQIIGYRNENVTRIGFSFLRNNLALKYIDLPNVESVANEFLYANEDLEVFNLPKLKTAGRYVLASNKKLKVFNAENLEKAGHGLLLNNHVIEEINVPNFIDSENILGDFKDAKIIKKEALENNEEVEKKQEVVEEAETAEIGGEL